MPRDIMPKKSSGLFSPRGSSPSSLASPRKTSSAAVVAAPAVPAVPELLPKASDAVRAMYGQTLEMSNDEVRQLSELMAASHADRSTYMSTEAWKFSMEAYAVAGNSACADCGATELLTWASSIVSDDFTVVLCNECCGGHRALGVHLSKPLSIKMDKWTDEQMQKLLQTGNAKVNEVFEAHESAASKKPDKSAEAEIKHAYIRSKYEKRAFCAGGDGALLEAKMGKKHSSYSGASSQVHAGIAIIRVVKGVDLVAADLNGKSDPYCKVGWGANKRKTKIIKETLNPVWNETLQLNVESVTDAVEIEVKDDDPFRKNDPLGDTTFSLAELEPNKATEMTLPLQNVSKGQIVLEVTWCPLDG